jgi:hypothetical protein
MVRGPGYFPITGCLDELERGGAPGLHQAEDSVSVTLTGMYGGALHQAEAATTDQAARSLSQSIWLGVLVLLFTIGAFVAALILASRLAGRLRRLRNKTIELADVQLPSMVLRRGRAVRRGRDPLRPRHRRPRSRRVLRRP